MRTPEEMAEAVVDCWINDSEGNYVQGDPGQAAAALLAAWRDECVAEAPASEVDAETMERLAANEHDRWAGQARTALDEMTPGLRERLDRLSKTPYADLTEEMKELDRMQVREYLALLSRAPRAGSDEEWKNHAPMYHELVKERDQWKLLAEGRKRFGLELIDKLEAAEAERNDYKRLWQDVVVKLSVAEAARDRLKVEMRFIEESMRPMAKINAELEAERDRLKEEDGRLNRLVDAEAGLRRMAGDDKAEMGAELRRLREENEALREIISESAPVAWVGRDDIASAKAWEIKATALLRAEGAAR